MSRDLDPILAAIDGALADDEFPDAMRWSPEPETVDAPAPYDGDLVWQPLQRYERIGPRGLVPDLVIVDDPIDLGLGDPFARAARRAELYRPLPVRHAWGDELYLVDSAWRSAVAAERAAELDRAWQAIREVFAAAAEQLRPLMDLLGEAARAAGVEVTKFVEEFTRQALAEQRDRPPPPLPDLRRVDPRGYALQLRQSRGTGPDRQLQRQHRPRRVR